MSDTPLSPPPRFAWAWAGWWTLVFVGNLPIPLLFGYEVVDKEGVFGLVGALVVLYWLGFTLCLFRFRVGRSLVWGGLLVAISQTIPILQIVCGSLGMAVWEAVGGRPLMQSGDYSEQSGWQSDRNLAAFVIVFVTAHPLLVVAVLIGAGVRAMYGDGSIWFTRRTDPEE